MKPCVTPIKLYCDKNSTIEELVALSEAMLKEFDERDIRIPVIDFLRFSQQYAYNTSVGTKKGL